MIIIADIIMIIHLLWAIFMIIGLPLGLLLRSPLLRWAHLAGMVFTGFFAVLGMYCPLTTWEEQLRWQADPGFTYRGSFLAEHLSPILYPQIEPWTIRAASISWMTLTVLAMVCYRPGRGKFWRRKNRT
jgi:hypothetical protein